MFCPNCGTPNDDNGQKCQKCGFNLKGAAAPKFKGTMLMMNSPLASSPPRATPAAGALPAGVPKPKFAAKATMIGVAPPPPGAVAPPAVSRPAPPTSVGESASAPKLDGPLSGPPKQAPIPRPAGSVNPFGGTMLMGASLPQVPATAAIEQVPVQPAPDATPDAVDAERTFASGGVTPAAAVPQPKLESTTPSVTPPAQDPAGAAVGMAVDAPAMATFATGSPIASPDVPGAGAVKPAWPGHEPQAAAAWGGPVGMTTASAGSQPVGRVRPIGLVLVFGIITAGIYWLWAMWGALNDFKSLRQKSDVVPLRYFIPILGSIEMTRLPDKVQEARVAAGVVNPVHPKAILYVFFPQVFFIADLNEILEAAAKRTRLSSPP